VTPPNGATDNSGHSGGMGNIAPAATSVFIGSAARSSETQKEKKKM